MDFEKLRFKENDNSIENQLEKPQKLYRGMRERNREYFDPKENIAKRDPGEKSLVFATPDKAFATMFLVPEASDSWTIKGKYDGVWVHIIADEDLYKELDVGGSVYEITDLDGFYCEREKGMKECEWTCDKDVFPSSSEEYENSVDAMIENGVQVYFVDDETFFNIATSEDKGVEVLNKLQSENQKKGKNIIQIRSSREKTHGSKKDRVKLESRMEYFLSNYYTRNFQKYIATLDSSARKELIDEFKKNVDVVEKMMDGSDCDLSVFSQNSQEALKILQNDMNLYKSKHKKSYERFVKLQIKKLRSMLG